MVYAQIKNGIVCNTIVVDEETPLDLFSAGFDFFLRIDELNPHPGRDWLYNGQEFSPPPVESNESE